MNRARRLLVPSILACALLAALALAATASAEIRVGEATAPVNPALKAEADIIGAKAEYESNTGAVTFKVTTAALPSPGTEAEPNELEMAAALASTSNCSSAVIEGGGSVYPAFIFDYQYRQPGFVTWSILESSVSVPKFENGTGGLAARTAGVTTTTFEGIAPKAANLPFSCALVEVHIGNATQGQPLIFPIAVPPPPAPPATPTQNQAPPPVTAPQHAPAALSIPGTKPLKLKAGKWTTVRINVANPGGSATLPGSLRLKPSTGVLVKPARQKLPVLNAGGTWTVSAKVQLTPKAKPKSTVSLTAAAGPLTAKGSLVLKRLG
ncbi:MAG: hypothetical protein JSU06_01515 [Actinobacteria bacterium]|nr:hypothetical protein [Actinomycetota bacterium]